VITFVTAGGGETPGLKWAAAAAVASAVEVDSSNLCETEAAMATDSSYSVHSVTLRWWRRRLRGRKCC
jgi:hypothetical protein